MPPAGLEPATQQRIVEQLYTKSRGVVVLDVVDSSAFAAAHRAARQHPPRIVEFHLQNALRPHGWIVHVWPGVLAGVLTAAGVDLTRLRADSTPRVQALPQLQARLRLRLRELPPETPTAPNVIARLEGRDSMLREEYVVLLAHMDARSGLPARQLSLSMPRRSSASCAWCFTWDGTWPMPRGGPRSA